MQSEKHSYAINALRPIRGSGRKGTPVRLQHPRGWEEGLEVSRVGGRWLLQQARDYALPVQSEETGAQDLRPGQRCVPYPGL